MAPPSPLVFISHVYNDSQLAKRLATALTKKGANVWASVNMLDDVRHWERDLLTAVNKAKVFVLLCTHDFFRSEWALMEIGAAMSRATADQSIKIIPVIVDVTTRSIPQYLKQWQVVDGSSQSVDDIATKVAATIKSDVMDVHWKRKVDAG